MIVAQKQLQALIVTWRKPTDRAYIPLGRLISGLGPDYPEYEFAFLNGVKDALAQGLGPLLAFPDINRVYRSNELFPFFQNRVMQPGRPDYSDFVNTLALEPEHATPMDILIRTGGSRVTDPFEIFECPVQPMRAGCFPPYSTHFLAHGLRHLSKLSLNRINSLQCDEQLYLMCDCQNNYDGRALAMRTSDRIIVGYLPGFLLEEALRLWEQCQYITCYVVKANPPTVPLQQRLLCRLETCWPEGFRPFATEPFRPISTEATDFSAR
jgi:hypothetical protein